MMIMFQSWLPPPSFQDLNYGWTQANYPVLDRLGLTKVEMETLPVKRELR